MVVPKVGKFAGESLIIFYLSTQQKPTIGGFHLHSSADISISVGSYPHVSPDALEPLFTAVNDDGVGFAAVAFGEGGCWGAAASTCKEPPKKR